LRALVSGVLIGTTAKLRMSSKKADGIYEGAISVALLSGESGGLSMIFPITSVYTSPVVYVRLALNDGTANGNEASFSSVVLLDLTAAFGAGCEPTAAQMDAFLARWPNSFFSGTANIAPQDKTLNTLVEVKRQLDERTGYGVASGLAITAQSTPNMTVAIAAGVCYEANGMRYAVTAVSAQAITASDATNPRIDAIYEHRGGAYYLAGTAVASPVPPTIPSDGLLLAWVSVAAGVTAITSAMITSKKKTLNGEDWITPTLLNGATASIPVAYRKDMDGTVHLRGIVTSPTLGVDIFVLPAGYRPNTDEMWFVTFAGTASIANISKPRIMSGGSVRIYYYGTSVSLAGISFKADQ
jgi:hypothetical protein